MAWVYLVVAGFLEVVWAIAMKRCDRSPWIFAGMVMAMIASFYLLWRAMQTIGVGTAYAVWTGIGAIGVATAGILAFGEVASPRRIISIALVVAGIVGLKASAR